LFKPDVLADSKQSDVQEASHDCLAPKPLIFIVCNKFLYAKSFYSRPKILILNFSTAVTDASSY